MPTIILLTAAKLPTDDEDTPALASALGDLRLDARIVPWNAPDLRAAGADLVVIRSTWDYTSQVDEFVATLAALPTRLANPVDVVRWNCHKAYLTELAAAGVPVVPTVLVLKGTPPLVRKGTPTEELPDFGTDEIVIKPAVAAGARGIGRFAAGSADARRHLRATLEGVDVLVQPYLPEVAAGERSLIYLGGIYSHAVRKTPAAGDFRVQERHGGVNSPHSASSGELATAGAALAAVPGGGGRLLYARVDLIGSAESPLVMELELIEPGLFLSAGVGAVQRLAEAIAELI